MSSNAPHSTAPALPYPDDSLVPVHTVPPTGTVRTGRFKLFNKPIKVYTFIKNFQLCVFVSNI